MHKLVEGVMTDVAPKEKPAKVKKKLPLPKLKYVFVVVLVLVATGAGAYLLLRDSRKSVNCDTVMQDVQKMTAEVAATTLEKYKPLCIDGDQKEFKLSGNVTDIKKITFLDLYSQQLYKIGDKDKAKEIAQQTGARAKAVPYAEVDKLSVQDFKQLDEAVRRAYKIQNGQDISSPEQGTSR